MVTLTPPVCGAVFIASGMIGANWLKVALTAMSLGVGLYIIPLALAADIALIQIADRPGAAILMALRTGIGLWLISRALISPDVGVLRFLMIGLGGLVIFAPVSLG